MAECSKAFLSNEPYQNRMNFHNGDNHCISHQGLVVSGTDVYFMYA